MADYFSVTADEVSRHFVSHDSRYEVWLSERYTTLCDRKTGALAVARGHFVALPDGSAAAVNYMALGCKHWLYEPVGAQHMLKLKIRMNGVDWMIKESDYSSWFDAVFDGKNRRIAVYNADKKLLSEPGHHLSVMGDYLAVNVNRLGGLNWLFKARRD